MNIDWRTWLAVAAVGTMVLGPILTALSVVVYLLQH
jgi:hypothetical protein